MKCEKGFTLAEVLTVLGIVGFIAGITIPNLITSYQKKQVVTKYKKAFSEISQAVEKGQFENGMVGSIDLSGETDKTKAFGDKFLYPYIKTTKKCDINEAGCWTPTKFLSGAIYHDLRSSNSPSAITASGYSILFWSSSTGNSIQIWVDIDGLNKGKSMLGRDVFGFFIYSASVVASGLYKPGVQPAGLESTTNVTRDELKNDAMSGCSTSIPHGYPGRYCGGLIAIDGWQIADDYPWKR